MTDATAGSTVDMEDFFKTVGEVRSLIENLSCQADKVEGRQGAHLSTPNLDKRQRDDLKLLNDETKNNANLVRAKLKSMQENFPVEENGEQASVIQRIQKNQHSHLTRCFAEVMRGYHKAQISFREKCKAQIQRQLEIVDKVTTDEDLEEMLHRDDLAIFICDINSDALSEIESRHQDIICLESSIKELHEIFADTAVLLEVQGDLINNIEKNVTSAAEYVDVSKAKTSEAVAYKKNRHKIASLPSFFKSFKRKTTAKTAPDQNASHLNLD
ncbi:syntaxin-2-like [Cyclopterus lumpus]|uniref:t-SNARE coiled-coil homology domain-containing protein n=1 Tax=Cyclopterus lumpus TaxID=8103 RepID=A0A8C3ATT1_CYCLU|nr:syntaxin-2-like [Cyclopterus lumpus]XP_034402627.1 syntaxin-2-like [Cyclopterus lumpus]XP_034402628.1 syntaxin-2-like [Cyclopterus lumpus]XP_034402629.1 syntaxin-2-like [Cyclopterus lumpus]XP_034402630.1 syntaxin-2-like [Cyclopterus lumpus]XP_034402631.1 syntaxin-2-like [Cyclopterus lumpus]XP_034402632.1 syntaxin-2-like [Cyclopterus lumpus]XP_034402633.1 syntaxin-2-like [Cyclopterus lumpus]XP_034402634.1 syntaxin-2-like [Cyclopterus lumpus]